jgi:hypothetical protein
MPAVPLGLKSYKRLGSFEPEVRLVNLFIEPDESGASPDSVMRVQRPGLVQVANLPGPALATYQGDNVLGGALFAIVGRELWTAYPAPALVATFNAPAGTAVLAGRQGTLFALIGTNLFAWDGTTATAVPIPDGYVPVDIETVNGYLIIACSTGRFYWIEPGSLTIDPLNFATVESSPDGLLCVRRLVDELFFGGTTSIEPWQPSGDQDAPFQKAGGRQYERGVLSGTTMRRFDNSLFWVGEDCIVYRAASVPTRVSDHGIEERLRKRSGPPSAWTFTSDGHNFYVLDIPGQGTFAFDAATNVWAEFSTPGVVGWTARRGVTIGGVGYATDVASGKVWRIDPDAATDGALAFPRIVSGTVAFKGRGPRNDSFSLAMGASADCTVMVRWRDGLEDYPAHPEALSARAGHDVVNLYRLGQLRQPSRTFEVSVTDPVRIRISGALANEAWQ